ncbi:Threonine/homoserine exporter RhtA [Halomicronema hongdechloris C2206]|uniref:Threonine/homoserine exporter RhtA n=1 Tax=Halomicronema hongdechloris C2206 TaxID=1641165 RepID=A0A1Z3HUL2_9CYAN|nr:EamA family transporter [Halomicronema hongdechloris]ASC73817.1 Threonine/homoserine exporter RhtA [Halomicronema hongdechloris C2206]
MMFLKVKTVSLPPTTLVLASIGSIQLGSALAKGLFDQISPTGMVALRVGLVAAGLLLLWRPSPGSLCPGQLWPVAALRPGPGCHESLLLWCDRTDSHWSSRRPTVHRSPGGGLGPFPTSLRWALGGLAAAGIGLLIPVQGLALDPMGMGLALLGGACWGTYMLLSAKVGRLFPQGEGLALAMVIAAMALLPLGVWVDGPRLLQPLVLVTGVGVALLSSAVPYSLEMAALQRLPLQVFGVLLSLEPAVAALIALVVLGETLVPRMVGAIVLITLAAVGSSQGPPLSQ